KVHQRPVLESAGRQEGVEPLEFISSGGGGKVHPPSSISREATFYESINHGVFSFPDLYKPALQVHLRTTRIAR
ncbi:MAG: hypothetical protein JXR96_28195, partial [Deltaproteobacteria bacterium]|nr:hypothetical protein [Deltaproteobacteria bacterium]